MELVIISSILQETSADIRDASVLDVSGLGAGFSYSGRESRMNMRAKYNFCILTDLCIRDLGILL